MMRTVFGSPLSDADFHSIVELDRREYGDGIFTNPERTVARFRKCPDCFVRVYSGEALVGAMCMYPVTDSLMKRAYLSDTLVDDDIGADEVLTLSRERLNNLINLDIIVAPEFRGQGVADMLLDGMKNFVNEKKKDGFRFGKLFGFAVSDGGRGVLVKHGAVILKSLPDGSGQLYEIGLE